MFKLVNQVKFGTPNHNGGKSRVSAAHVVLEKKKKTKNRTAYYRKHAWEGLGMRNNSFFRQNPWYNLQFNTHVESLGA